jgi:RNA polymerase sigma factor (sigma-70 family)
MGEEPDDAALVRATLGGEKDAFARLYDRYAAVVRAICYDASADLTQAQDLGQEAFLRAYRKLARLRKPERFAAWLIGITRHVCLEWRRGEGRKRRFMRSVKSLTSRSELVSEDAASAEDESRRLTAAITTLPARERHALHVFYLQEQPVDAAARLLGLSRSGFYRRLERAKERLRRLLGLEALCESVNHDATRSG